MKVKYRNILWGDKALPYHYRIDSKEVLASGIEGTIKWCCKDMEYNFCSKGNVDFSEGMIQLNFSPEDDAGFVDFNFCPWCGEKVETECVKTTKWVLKESAGRGHPFNKFVEEEV